MSDDVRKITYKARTNRKVEGGIKDAKADMLRKEAELNAQKTGRGGIQTMGADSADDEVEPPYEEVNRLVRTELYEHVDMEFGKYLAMQLPGCGDIIGVRLDDLKNIAQEIAGINWKEYLKHALGDTVEEVLLQGLVIGYAEGKLEEILAYADEFIPKIDNWWVCDSFCASFAAARQYPDIVWDFVMKYMGDSELNPLWRKKQAENRQTTPEGQGGVTVGSWQDMSDDFRIRFIAIMLKCYYINEDYIDKCLYAFAHMQSGGYYAKSGVAFGLAEAYFRFPDRTRDFVQKNTFDDEIVKLTRETLEKIYRMPPEEML